MRTDESHLKIFEDLRPQLTGLAYRMTGSLSDADDVVQDAWLRWSRVNAASIGAPKPYLLQIVARLCVDQATSARARREVYVGPWLPEPVADPLAVGVVACCTGGRWATVQTGWKESFCCRFGVTTAAEVDIDTLETRLLADLTANDAVMIAPPFTAGWTRITE